MIRLNRWFQSQFKRGFMNYLAIDSGTTNTRIWLMQSLRVLKRVQISVGVRNTAIDSNNLELTRGIMQAIQEVSKSVSLEEAPLYVVAAGMITSGLGLHEVKHVQSPAGIRELSARVETRCFPELAGLPFYFVPGVRSGPTYANLDNANEIDIVRGEETELTGFLCQYNLQGPLLYIHLGSHTKFLKVDSGNRICGGLSTLAGEVMGAIEKGTILSDSLPGQQPLHIEESFLQEGWNICRKLGLLRTLYLVRILHLNSEYTKQSLASLFLGAMISEDFRCLEALLTGPQPERIVLSGLPQFHPAWTYFLEGRNIPFQSLTAEETEQSFLRGAHEIVSLYCDSKAIQ